MKNQNMSLSLILQYMLNLVFNKFFILELLTLDAYLHGLLFLHCTF